MGVRFCCRRVRRSDWAIRVTLWNEVERVEKRKDAQLSREMMVALPAELTHEQKQSLTREYVRG